MPNCFQKEVRILIPESALPTHCEQFLDQALFLLLSLKTAIGSEHNEELDFLIGRIGRHCFP
jgi:hypothetical protein